MKTNVKLSDLYYSSDMVNSNMINSKFHFIQSFCEVFTKCFPIISCLKCTVNLYFYLFRKQFLSTNDFELTVPDLYHFCVSLSVCYIISIKSEIFQGYRKEIDPQNTKVYVEFIMDGAEGKTRGRTKRFRSRSWRIQ